VGTMGAPQERARRAGSQCANERGEAGGQGHRQGRHRDITLQQVLTRPDEFDVVATMNLNGDYLSERRSRPRSAASHRPGRDINYMTGHAVFEATHARPRSMRTSTR